MLPLLLLRMEFYRLFLENRKMLDTIQEVK